MFFKKIRHYVFDDISNVKISFVEKEIPNGVIESDETTHRLIFKKKGDKMFVSFDKKLSNPTKITISTIGIESFSFNNSGCFFFINNKSKELFPKLIFNNSQAVCSSLKSDTIDLKMVNSNLKLEKAFVNLASMDLDSSNLTFNEGIISKLTCRAKNTSKINSKDKRNFVLNVDQAYASERSKIKLNVINEINHHIESGSRLIAKGDALNISNKIGFNDQFKKIILSGYGIDVNTHAHPLSYYAQYHLKMDDNTFNAIEHKDYDSVPFIIEAKESASVDIFSMIRDYQNSVSQIVNALRNIDSNDFKDLSSIVSYFNNEIERAHLICTKINLANMHFENQEYKDFVFTTKKSLNQLNKELRLLESKLEKEEKTDLNYEALNKLLDNPFPTDDINANNRSFFVKLLKHCDPTSLGLDKTKNKRLIKLLKLFDIENKKVKFVRF